MPDRARLLSDLLQTLFKANADLHAFLLALDGGAGIDDALPDLQRPPQEYRTAVVGQLLARGLVNDRFYARLAEKRPQHVAAIRRAHAAYSRSPPAANRAGAAEPKALLRALQPFGKDDTLYGRDMEVQAIETMVTGEDFRFGAVFGRTGCGKTSLLRAALMPRLRQRGFDAIYLARPAELVGTLQATRARIAASEREAPADEPFGTPPGLNGVAVIVDQFEELFLQQPAREALSELATLIASCMHAAPTPIRILVGIRDDFYQKLRSFSPQVPEPLRMAHSYELEAFTREVAAGILRTSRTTDDTGFEDDLITAVVEDLAAAGCVRPVELQIVATVLKRRHLKHVDDYEALGRARGMLRTYIENEIDAMPDKAAAARILRRLCDLERQVKALADASSEELQADLVKAGTHLSAETLDETLSRLCRARLIVETDQDHYNLIHDYLAPLVILATERRESEASKAARLLGKYVADHQDDPAVRIPLAHLRLIRRHARASITSNPRAMQLVRASVRSVWSHALLPLLALAGMLLIGCYAVLSRTNYLSTDSVNIAALGAPIVLRSGHPSLQRLPGFDAILVDTGYAMRDVVQDMALPIYDIPREVFWGFRSARAGAYESWIVPLIDRLTTSGQLFILRMLGDSSGAVKSVVTTALRNRELGSAALSLIPAIVAPDDARHATQYLSTLLQESGQADKLLLLPLQRYLVSTDAELDNRTSAYTALLREHTDTASAASGGPSHSAILSEKLMDLHSLCTLVLMDPSLVSSRDAIAVLPVVENPKIELERRKGSIFLLELMLLANSEIAKDILPKVTATLRELGDKDTARTGWVFLELLTHVVRAHPNDKSRRSDTRKSYIRESLWTSRKSRRLFHS
jgi:hypothetical protein